MAQEEFAVRRVALISTRDSEKIINDMFREGYEPFMTEHVNADLVVIFRLKRKQGRPTDKVPAVQE